MIDMKEKVIMSNFWIQDNSSNSSSLERCLSVPSQYWSPQFLQAICSKLFTIQPLERLSKYLISDYLFLVMSLIMFKSCLAKKNTSVEALALSK